MNFASIKENVIGPRFTDSFIQILDYLPYAGYSPHTWIKMMDKNFLLHIKKARKEQQHGLF